MQTNNFCHRCKSCKILSINAKCSDLCTLKLEHHINNGYVPDYLGIGGGDYIAFDLCIDCGQMQGHWPLSKDVKIVENDEEYHKKILEDARNGIRKLPSCGNRLLFARIGKK